MPPSTRHSNIKRPADWRNTSLHYALKHGNWLNMAEIGLSALNGQCLDRRIPDPGTMQGHIAAWEDDRNNRQSRTRWHLFINDARTTLEDLYPNLQGLQGARLAA